MRTLTDIDSDVIIKHESPVMINELKLNQLQTLRGEPRTAWTGAAACTAALENNWNEESLGASIY